jgi:hypothetical protein
MIFLLYLFVISGTLLVILSVPMILGKIPPNGLYGFRVKKTMENPDIWYPVNAYSGKWLLVVGLGLALAAVGLFFVTGLSLEVYAYTVLGVWGVLFAVAIIASIRYLNSF